MLKYANDTDDERAAFRRGLMVGAFSAAIVIVALAAWLASVPGI